jgi:hypothetical protein
MWILLTLFYTLCVLTGPAPVYPHVLVRIGQSCRTTSDCMASTSKRAWCNSGRTCAQGECYLIPNYPCPYYQTCNEKLQRCEVKACRRHGDCDDHIFCNGAEQCVNYTCTSDFKHDCTGGQCDEAKHHCYMPPELQKQRAHLTRIMTHDGTRTYNRLRAQTLGKDARLTIMDTNTTAPTEAPTQSSALNSVTSVAIIIAVVILVIFVFIFMMLALVR